MIPPPSIDHLPRGRMARLVLGLLALVVVVPVSIARAGDTQGPQTTIDCGPAAESPSTRAHFQFSSEDAAAPLFKCSLDGAPEQECESPLVLKDLAVGEEHVLTVYVIDRAAQPPVAEKTPESWIWVVTGTSAPFDGCDLPDVDGGVPETDAGSPEQDAGVPAQDAGSPGQDAGVPGQDGGVGPGADAGSPGQDAGTPSSDAGTPGGGADAGTTPDAGTPDGGTAPADEGPNAVPIDDGSDEATLDYLGAGVGCTGAPTPGAVAGLLLVALALRLRKRR